MTIKQPSSSSSLAILGTLALLCAGAIILRGSNQPQNNSAEVMVDGRIGLSPRQMKQTTIRKTNTNNIIKKGSSRNMVGGYSSMNKLDLLQSDEVMEIANFALNELASGSGSALSTTTSMVVLPEEVNSGAVTIKVLEAQRQVVAGLNYKLTIAVFKNNACQGAMKVTVYKPLPHMEQGLTVTSWGNGFLDCTSDDVVSLLEALQDMEEEVANKVEEEMEEEIEEVEPDS